MHLKMLFSVVVAACLGAGPALAQELTGTLKKIKETGAIALGHRESSVPCRFPTTTTANRSWVTPWTSAPGSSTA
jgi:hypothetical protein